LSQRWSFCSFEKMRGINSKAVYTRKGKYYLYGRKVLRTIPSRKQINPEKKALEMSKIEVSQSLKDSFREYKKIAFQVLTQQNIDIGEDEIDLKSYARYIFKEGNSKGKGEFIRGLGIPLYLHDKKIFLDPAKAN